MADPFVGSLGVDPFAHANIAFRIAGLNRLSYVKKDGDEWCVRSESNPNWNGGCYPTKDAAEKRLKQVEFFKHKSSSCACSGDKCGSDCANCGFASSSCPCRQG